MNLLDWLRGNKRSQRSCESCPDGRKAEAMSQEDEDERQRELRDAAERIRRINDDLHILTRSHL